MMEFDSFHAQLWNNMGQNVSTLCLCELNERFAQTQTVGSSCFKPPVPARAVCFINIPAVSTDTLLLLTLTLTLSLCLSLSLTGYIPSIYTVLYCSSYIYCLLNMSSIQPPVKSGDKPKAIDRLSVIHVKHNNEIVFFM